MAKKDSGQYRDYTTVIDGKLYGSVSIPLGKGKYKMKRKRVENKTEARQWALEILRQHGLGEEIETTEERREAKKGKSFQELADWYKEEVCFPPVYNNGIKQIGMRGHLQQRQLVDLICRYFGPYQLDAISEEVLKDYRKKRLTGKIVYSVKGQKKKRIISITGINREFATIRTMFLYAVSKDWMRKSPFTKQAKLIETKKEGKRKKILDDKIADELLKAVPKMRRESMIGELMTVLRWTGARPSEVFPYHEKDGDEVPREPLTWKNILKHDFKAVSIIEYKDVQRTERIVPAVPELERCLRDLYSRRRLAKPDDLLFPHRSYKTSFNAVREKAGFKKGEVVMRDFRAYFNNKLIEWKVADVMRMHIMGHTDVETNAGYASVTPQFIDAFRNQFTPPPIESEAVN